MKTRYLLAVATAALISSGSPAALAEGAVIANPALSLSSADVKDIFTGEKQLAGSTKITPVDNAAAQSDFLAKVLKMDATKYQTAWTKKSFRDGVTAPAVKGTDAEVVEFVKHTPGGVGYISGAAPSGVSVVTQY